MCCYSKSEASRAQCNKYLFEQKQADPTSLWLDSLWGIPGKAKVEDRRGRETKSCDTDRYLIHLQNSHKEKQSSISLYKVKLTFFIVFLRQKNIL